MDFQESYNFAKAMHIFTVISWFAGLFYLPRIYVNLAMIPKDSAAEYARLLLMAQKLYRFFTPIGVLAVASGLWLWLVVGIFGTWLYIKLFFVAFLVVYHFWCGMHLKKFTDQQNAKTHIWFRWFNEIPAIALLLVVWLAIFKPFS